MKKHLSLSVLLFVCSFVFSSCASDSSNNTGDGGSNVPVGTIRVKLNGTLKTYTPLSTIWSIPNNVITIHAKDPDVQIGDIRIFIHAPVNGAKDYPIEVQDVDGKSQIQLISIVDNNTTATLANTGVVRVSSISDSKISGTFNFTSSINGSGTGSTVTGSDGEFNLNMMKI